MKKNFKFIFILFGLFLFNSLSAEKSISYGFESYFQTQKSTYSEKRKLDSLKNEIIKEVKVLIDDAVNKARMEISQQITVSQTNAIKEAAVYSEKVKQEAMNLSIDHADKQVFDANQQLEKEIAERTSQLIKEAIPPLESQLMDQLENLKKELADLSNKSVDELKHSLLSDLSNETDLKLTQNAKEFEQLSILLKAEMEEFMNTRLEQFEKETRVNWADAGNIQNPTIQILENSLKEMKLPGQDDLNLNGLTQGELNTFLLQKLMEQSAYIIELQKQIEELKK